MPEWFEGDVKSNGIEIHYYRTGGDKPQVVMNHGAADDGLCWTRVALELEKDYDLILPDARGHGKSSTGDGDYSTKQRVADLAGLIDGLKLDRPVVGGHSMGAETSLHLAASYPDLTRGVFLEDPPIFLPGETFIFGDKVMEMKDIGSMMAKYLRIFKLVPGYIGVHMARKISPTYPDTEILPWTKAKRSVSFDFLNSLGSMVKESDNPCDVFRVITVPVLLFTGSKDKMCIVSEETALQAMNANPRVQVIHLEGASHDIRRTRFDGYLPALRNFLGAIYQPVAIQ
jgi:N-formylmaleamate deformylase